MMSSTGAEALVGPTVPSPAGTAEGRGRWNGLLVIGVAQLIALIAVVSDAPWRTGLTDVHPLPLLSGAVLLGVLAMRQYPVRRRSGWPALTAPRDGARVAAFLAVALTGFGLISAAVLAAYQLQPGHGYPAVLVGGALLPMAGVTLIAAGWISARLQTLLGSRRLMVPGLACTASGVMVFSDASSGHYALAGILPAWILLGLGSGLTVPSAMLILGNGASDPANGAGEDGAPARPAHVARRFGGAASAAAAHAVATLGMIGWLDSHGEPGSGAATTHIAHASRVVGICSAGALAAGAVAIVLLLRTSGKGVSANPSLGIHVLGSDGLPISDAVLTVFDEEGGHVMSARTAPGGLHQITVPKSGGYVLVASAGSYLPSASCVEIDGNSQDFMLQLAEVGTGAVSGNVRECNVRMALRDAKVFLVGADGKPVDTQVTSCGGGFRFDNLSTGDYVLAVIRDSYRPQARRIHVEQGDPVGFEVELEDSRLLEGMVRGGDNRPVAGGEVILADASGLTLTTCTGPDGRYRFDGLPSGIYSLAVSVSALQRARFEVSLTDSSQVHDVWLK